MTGERTKRWMENRAAAMAATDQRPYNIIHPKKPNQNRPNNTRQQQQGKHMNDDDPNSQTQHTRASRPTQMQIQIQIHMYKQKAPRYANANKIAATTMRRICTNHANLQLTNTPTHMHNTCFVLVAVMLSPPFAAFSFLRFALLCFADFLLPRNLSISHF